ncbi:hypothetical protein H9Q13_02380 [Pontibacter sp. JH31]|uniref:YARHG domain-containing protein n=1 Tax=Pontibacter aquaedesilientis TaxID=2766980 RepID=A0ABR7XCH9_9BACT|nr:hypothetical protein [Pontibacter aquaedesilientis]MBD1395999.1 hypothetical protein [Pontibacter aquaedesilientis]
MQLFYYRNILILALTILLGSCADNDFYQKDALVQPGELDVAPAGPDSVWVITGRHYERNWFHRLFWGRHNRDIWTTPVKLPVFNLSRVNGGMEVVKKGGGFQTSSFHLQDSLGRLYAFRSIDKDPVLVLAKFWRPTFVTNILRDQTSSANPYGAVVVPVLAEAAGVFHTSPKLYYVPAHDTSFGEYASSVQGKVYMLEEKFEELADTLPMFGNLSGFEDSDDALRKRYEYNTHHFNQHSFARARLLDILIGDWDRHKGQWDWAVYKDGAETRYEPIPKDRDQVFLKMNDGAIPFLATSKLMARKFNTFGPKVKDVKALMINARFIDERLLHELTREDWQKIAKELQSNLTDAVIERAVRSLPKTVYTLVGADMTQNLKRRRDQLPEVAEKMYEILAKEITIAGTDQEDIFQVRRLDDKRTEVTLTRPASGAIPERLLYRRIFLTSETEEITLHGLNGDDVFLLEGEVGEGLLVKVYGGLGSDEIIDRSSVKGWRRYTHIYDTERGNDIEFGKAKDYTTRDVRVHAYDREGN